MTHSPDSPQADDVVLGGHAPSPVDGVILGGLAGVKRRLANVDESIQVAALADAMKYGVAGIDLVIDALSDSSERVWQTADRLLRSIDTPKVKEALSLSEMRALAGVKRRLAHPDEGLRISALSEALKHGPNGISLVMVALRDPSERVWQTANALLRTVPDPRVKQALALFSAAGIKYTELSELLAAGCWLEADFQTKELMYKVSKLNALQQFRDDLIAKFPCEDLQILDRLWVKHSHGRFGFSVQKTIWSQCAASRWEKAEAWTLFGDRVGWRSNLPWNQNHWKQQDEITFNLNAPAGHLPFLGDTFGIFTIEAVSARLTMCGIH